MAAKQKLAEPEPKRKMTRTEAYKALHVAPTADEEIITQAYGYLARRCHADAKRSPEARQRLDELNEAITLLQPASAKVHKLNGAPPKPPPQEGEPIAVEEPVVADELFGWIRQVAAQIGERWPGRGTEIAALGASVALLAVLALNAGASALWTLLALGFALVVIVAPWRKA